MLDPLDQIECRDALLSFTPSPTEGEGWGGGAAPPTEATWPQVSVVIGNPPFVGNKKMRDADASLFAEPFAHVMRVVKPMRDAGTRESRKRRWWLHGETVPGLRERCAALQRYIATPRVAKHRYFVWLPVQVWPDSRLYAIARNDDYSFGILSSRIHEVWSLAHASMHGDGNDGGRPTYNARSCFETFAFPATDAAQQEAIARAAQRLNDLRDRWLNPPEWTRREPEVIPLGMDHSPYPDRVLPREGFEAQLALRTLTRLYNERPAWLAQAHEALDAAVAAAYGWADHSPQLPDEDILRRLLALNRERSGVSGGVIGGD